jgi:uncharacterized protein involved in type VI secretion and phage assembly
MPAFDDTEAGPRLPGVAIGVVTNRVDPLKLHRVRVRIPGLLEPESGWVWPLTIGGGSAGRGLHVVPAVGADVAVLFNQGDPDHPYYIGANWGMPGGVVETPGKVADRPPEEAASVGVLETERWRVVFDDNAATASLILEDKNNGNQIELDGTNEGITVKSRAAVRIETLGLVDIRALQVQINGRVVRAGTDPI